ncbi:MAG: hypothetical protein ACI9E9_000001, partial [Reinekea sp.]
GLVKTAPTLHRSTELKTWWAGLGFTLSNV